MATISKANKHAVLENESLADVRGADFLKEIASGIGLVEFVPRRHRPDELHERESLDEFGIGRFSTRKEAEETAVAEALERRGHRVFWAESAPTPPAKWRVLSGGSSGAEFAATAEKVRLIAHFASFRAFFRLFTNRDATLR